jgi:energy-coupling factor transport system permease protein
MFTVIVNGLRKAENTALAIESRGFGAYPDRTYVKTFHWTGSGLILILFFIAFSAWLLYWDRMVS